jgi:hypothetical protein
MRRTSIFFPSLLVAAGVLWLLAEMGRITFTNFLAINVLWPIVLIALGLGLILGSRWRFAWNAIALAVVTLTTLAIIFAPQLGLTTSGWTGSIPFVWSSQRGSGHVVTQSRQVADFTGVTVDYPSDVYITQGLTDTLSIEGEDNVLQELTTQVNNGILTIGVGTQDTLGSAILPTRSVRITITVKNLTDLNVPSAGTTHLSGINTKGLNVSISGAGNVIIDNLVAQSLTSHLSGAGNVTASGSAADVKVNISGFGSFHGSDLRSDTASASISGAGSATLWVTKQLEAVISGLGSVNYYGQPNVNQQVGGIGSVRSLGNK